MSDIDFDELDRAVHSALNGSSPKSPEPVQSPASEVTPEPPVGKTIAAAAQALHPVASKPVQRGRFLDMIHPSHDMAPRSVQPVERPITVASPANHQTFVGDVVAKESSTDDIPLVVPERHKAEEKSHTDAPVVPEPPKEAAPDDSKPAEPVDFFAGGAPVEGKSGEPTQSPFIPDAKVEKRPLGAFTPLESSTLPVGDELHDQLVQVESEDNVVEIPETPAPAAAPTPAPAVVAAPEPTAVAPVTLDTEDSPLASLAHDKHLKNRLNKPPKHGKSAIIWITVAIAVTLIGIGVGATVFTVVLR